MTIEIDCPTCGRKLRAPESAAGKKAKCRSCQNVFQLPKPLLKAQEPRSPVVEIDEEPPEYQPESDAQAEGTRNPRPVVEPPHSQQFGASRQVQVPLAQLTTPLASAPTESYRTVSSVPRDVLTLAGPSPAPSTAEPSHLDFSCRPSKV